MFFPFQLDQYSNLYIKYENFVGLTDVKESQGRVIQAETEFLNKQSIRIEKRMALDAISNKLFLISSELDKVLY